MLLYSLRISCYERNRKQSPRVFKKINCINHEKNLSYLFINISLELIDFVYKL